MVRNYHRVIALKHYELVLMNSKLWDDEWDNSCGFEEGLIFGQDYYTSLWSSAFAEDYFRDLYAMFQVVTGGEDISEELGGYVLGEKATNYFYQQDWGQVERDNVEDFMKTMRKKNPFYTEEA